jgi:hypothetical protein
VKAHYQDASGSGEEQCGETGTIRATAKYYCIAASFAAWPGFVSYVCCRAHLVPSLGSLADPVALESELFVWKDLTVFGSCSIFSAEKEFSLYRTNGSRVFAPVFPGSPPALVAFQVSLGHVSQGWCFQCK